MRTVKILYATMAGKNYLGQMTYLLWTKLGSSQSGILHANYFTKESGLIYDRVGRFWEIPWSMNPKKFETMKEAEEAFYDKVREKVAEGYSVSISTEEVTLNEANTKED